MHFSTKWSCLEGPVGRAIHFTKYDVVSGCASFQSTLFQFFCHYITTWQSTRTNQNKCLSVVCKTPSSEVLSQDGNEIDNVQYAKLIGVTISSDLTWNKHVENIVAKAGKRVYMLYQLKRAGICQHDIVTIYVSVIRPVLEYSCPVWHTNLNRHLTESIETVPKKALKCIYPGNEYADILCLTTYRVWRKDEIACVKNISKK